MEYGFQWLKAKHEALKPKGRYKSTHDMGKRKRPRGPLHKKGPKTHVYGERVRVVNGLTGAARMESREI